MNSAAPYMTTLQSPNLTKQQNTVQQKLTAYYHNWYWFGDTNIFRPAYSKYVLKPGRENNNFANNFHTVKSLSILPMCYLPTSILISSGPKKIRPYKKCIIKSNVLFLNESFSHISHSKFIFKKSNVMWCFRTHSWSNLLIMVN